MDAQTNTTLTVLATLSTALQAAALYILHDLRSRVARLEDLHFFRNGRPTQKNPRQEAPRANSWNPLPAKMKGGQHPKKLRTLRLTGSAHHPRPG